MKFVIPLLSCRDVFLMQRNSASKRLSNQRGSEAAAQTCSQEEKRAGNVPYSPTEPFHDILHFKLTLLDKHMAKGVSVGDSRAGLNAPPMR